MPQALELQANGDEFGIVQVVEIGLQCCRLSKHPLRGIVNAIKAVLGRSHIKNLNSVF